MFFSLFSFAVTIRTNYSGVGVNGSIGKLNVVPLKRTWVVGLYCLLYPCNFFQVSIGNTKIVVKQEKPANLSSMNSNYDLHQILPQKPRLKPEAYKSHKEG